MATTVKNRKNKITVYDKSFIINGKWETIVDNHEILSKLLISVM